MSQSFDITTAYDALDDSLVYDVFNMDSYCASLNTSISPPESVPHTPAPGPHLKHYPKTCGHPHPSPTVVLPPAVASTSSQSPVTPSQSRKSIPAKPDKGKGRQHSTPTPTPSCSVDHIPSPSVGVTPEQHLCFVRMLKRLDEWLTQGWQPGVDESHLRTLAEIFNAAESVAESSLSNIHQVDLAWRLADSEGWEKSAGSSIMGVIDIQVTITKILYKDYGDVLITSFRSFLGQKEAELGNSGCPSGISGPSLQENSS